jgi:hypothetical protein
LKAALFHKYVSIVSVSFERSIVPGRASLRRPEVTCEVRRSKQTVGKNAERSTTAVIFLMLTRHHQQTCLPLKSAPLASTFENGTNAAPFYFSHASDRWCRSRDLSISNTSDLVSYSTTLAWVTTACRAPGLGIRNH